METWLGALKVFVVVAGIVIVLGTGTLVWLLVQRGLPKDRPGAFPTASGPAAETLAIPPGMHAISAQLDGGRALLLLVDGDGAQHLLLVDLTTGERLGLLRIVPERP